MKSKMHSKSLSMDTKQTKVNDVTPINPNRNIFVSEPFPIVRKPKLRPTFIKGINTVALKTIDFNEVRKLKEKNERIHLKKLNKIARGNDRYRKLTQAFSDKFELLTSTKFAFQKKRMYTIDRGNGEGPQTHMYDSDSKRLINIFKKLEEKTNKIDILGEMLMAMMEKWSQWDKCQANNLMGFLEKQCTTEDIGMYYMKARQKTGNDAKSTILNESVRLDNADKQRKLFAS